MTEITPFPDEEWDLMIQAADSISQSIFAMLADRDRWITEVRGKVYRHDTGILIQLRRHKDRGSPDGQHMVVWMEGMAPFRAYQYDRTPAIEFFHGMRERETMATIEKVGVIAKLCAE